MVDPGTDRRINCDQLSDPTSEWPKGLETSIAFGILDDTSTFWKQEEITMHGSVFSTSKKQKNRKRLDLLVTL